LHRRRRRRLRRLRLRQVLLRHLPRGSRAPLHTHAPRCTAEHAARRLAVGGDARLLPREGVSAWAGGRDHTPSRVPQRWGTTSCREAAPLTPHAQPGIPQRWGNHQLSRGSPTYLKGSCTGGWRHTHRGCGERRASERGGGAHVAQQRRHRSTRVHAQPRPLVVDAVVQPVREPAPAPLSAGTIWRRRKRRRCASRVASHRALLSVVRAPSYCVAQVSKNP
jgi:hypothetical protein